VTTLLVLLGAGLGGGLVLLAWGIRPVEPPPVAPKHRSLFPDLSVRLVRMVVAALVVSAVTRWPVAAVAGGGFGFFAGDLFSGRSQRHRGVEKSAAIAAWTEMLRDTIAAVSGLEEAIVATAHLAPPEIRGAVGDLVIRLEREPLSASLGQLSEDLADPTADLVIAALSLAARGEAKELGDLLSALAETARDNASMRVRVDAVRAGTRTAVRIISAVTVAMLALLLVFNRTYLQPFDTAVGQVVLVVIFGGFAAGLTWLAAMSRYQAPQRFVLSSSREVDAG
jgi:tight adherence protein B